MELLAKYDYLAKETSKDRLEDIKISLIFAFLIYQRESL